MSQNSKVQSLFKGSIALIISNMCLKAINFFLLPLYTSNLTPSMLGVSDSITTFTGFLFPLLTFGLDSAYSAFYFDEEDSLRAEKVYSTLTMTFLIIGIFPIIFGFVFSNELSQLLFGTNEYQIIVTMALMSISFNLWFLPLSLELRLENRMASFGLINVISSLLMIGFNILFVSILKIGESSLVLSTMIVHFICIFLFFVFVKKIPHKKYFDYSLLKNMYVFSIPLVPLTVMNWVLSLSDRYVLLYFCGKDSVGLYGIGTRIMTVLNLVISAVTTAYTTFAYSSKTDENAKEQYYDIFNVLALVLLVFSFTVSVFSKEIISVMASENYGDAYVSVRDLLFSQAIYGLSVIVGYGILFNKKTSYSLLSVSVAAVVNLILNIIYIPKYGIAAAAATTLVGFVIQFIITYFLSEKLYPCDYGIRRVLGSFAFVYILSFVLERISLSWKIIIYLVAIIFILYLFKDVVIKLRDFFIRMLKKDKLINI